jgi:hypothetical protein
MLEGAFMRQKDELLSIGKCLDHNGKGWRVAGG